MAYADIMEADDYMATKLNNEAWFDLPTEKRQAYLEEATRVIKSIPMINIPKEIGCDIKIACCEIAFNILEKGGNENPHAKNIKYGISSISFGNDSVSYGNSSRTIEEIYQTTYSRSLLDKYIQKAVKIV